MYCLSPRIGTLVRMIFFFSLRASSVSTLQSKSGECPVINNELYTAHSCRKSYSAVITVCMRTYNLNWKINLSVKQHYERIGDLINPFKSQMTFHWNSYRYKNKVMNKHVYAVLLYGEIERHIFLKSLLPRTKNIQLWFTLFYLYKLSKTRTYITMHDSKTS